MKDERPTWEKLGMDRTEFRDHPQRAMLIRRANGMRISTCCEMERLKEMAGNKFSEVLLQKWFEDNAEKQTILDKYPKAVLS